MAPAQASSPRYVLAARIRTRRRGRAMTVRWPLVSMTAKPMPKAWKDGREVKAGRALPASRTTHARSTPMAALSACTSALRHLLSLSSAAIRWAATGVQAGLRRTLVAVSSTAPASSSGTNVDFRSAFRFEPTAPATVSARVARSWRSASRTLTLVGETTGLMPAAIRVANASSLNVTASTSRMPRQDGTSRSTTSAT